MPAERLIIQTNCLILLYPHTCDHCVANADLDQKEMGHSIRFAEFHNTNELSIFAETDA